VLPELDCCANRLQVRQIKLYDHQCCRFRRDVDDVSRRQITRSQQHSQLIEAGPRPRFEREDSGPAPGALKEGEEYVPPVR
jgi:hypothetical protein